MHPERLRAVQKMQSIERKGLSHMGVWQFFVAWGVLEDVYWRYIVRKRENLIVIKSDF